MLSWGQVLVRIKDDLLTPNTPLEKTDDEIISYLIIEPIWQATELGD